VVTRAATKFRARNRIENERKNGIAPGQHGEKPELSLFASLGFNGDAGTPELDNHLNDLSQSPSAHRQARSRSYAPGSDIARGTPKNGAIPRRTKAAPNISETDCFLARPLAMTLDQIEGRCFDFIFSNMERPKAHDRVPVRELIANSSDGPISTLN
jgi:hypothetical protein